jgi:hypothetical protein
LIFRRTLKKDTAKSWSFVIATMSSMFDSSELPLAPRYWKRSFYAILRLEMPNLSFFIASMSTSLEISNEEYLTRLIIKRTTDVIDKMRKREMYIQKGQNTVGQGED